MKTSLRTLVKAGLAVSALTAGSLVVPATVSAQEIDVDFCTNFYPELCLGEDGEIDPALFPFLIDGVAVPGYTDPRYDVAVAALARHRAGDDTDGNGIPDSPEIGVCGEPGCLDDWAATAEVTEPDAKILECCDGDNENTINKADISKGMNKNKLVSVFTLSTPVVHYVGAYPDGGKVEVRSDPPRLEVGVHRIVAVGTADGLNEAEVKVWRLDVITEKDVATSTTAGQSTSTTAQVAGQTQSTAAATTARTGADVGKWVMGGSALVLLGSALVIGARRRRSSI